MSRSKETFSTEARHPNTLILGIYTPANKIANMDAYFDEFLSLIDTLKLKYDHTIFMKVRMLSNSMLLTKGKLKEIVDFCEANDIEEVICSESLSPLQERNLSHALNARVYDRSRVILDIFREAAHTAEGKTQVEIAELEYLKTRIAGRGVELAQQAGYIGTRGPGETIKEQLKRHYNTKIRQAKKRLKTLEQSRNIQRKKRINSDLPLVSLVGYTNAGKSSLLNRLTKSDVYVEDKLFATLDATTRSLHLSDKKRVLLSDTVGFISQLPHHLIEAFKSTLDELQYATLLLVVVDITDPMWEDHLAVVHDILDELNLEKNILYVFNKVDQVIEKASLPFMVHRYAPYVFSHTLDKDGVSDLLAYLKKFRFS